MGMKMAVAFANIFMAKIRGAILKVTQHPSFRKDLLMTSYQSGAPNGSFR